MKLRLLNKKIRADFLGWKFTQEQNVHRKTKSIQNTTAVGKRGHGGRDHNPGRGPGRLGGRGRGDGRRAGRVNDKPDYWEMLFLGLMAIKLLYTHVVDSYDLISVKATLSGFRTQFILKSIVSNFMF